ncbi:glycoprotein E [Gallid alphaherpesvirus 3]|uniref:Envelope glycoprotein E n=4 Tax=Alphaherpesvirinae TaxID=10293 RepID=Q786E7_9ALPH|nr:glycoprotein homolog E [Gallid alphaherpesvirus 1]BAA32013.1 glycoprotein E [Marek's disease virus serotype 2 MDV2]BAB16592.1 glycoprotein E [Gallid alphaherpesvirus 3]
MLDIPGLRGIMSCPRMPLFLMAAMMCSATTVNRILIPQGNSATLKISRYPPVVDGTPYTETWTWISNRCNETATGYVCLDSVNCFHDLIVKMACWRYSKEVILRTARFVVERGVLKTIETAKLRNAPRVLIVDNVDTQWTVLNASEQNAGIYIRYSRNGTRTAHVDAIVLAVSGRKRGRVPPTVYPVGPFLHKFQISLKNFKTFLYQVGDTVTISITTRLETTVRAFKLEFRVMFLPYSPNCKSFTIYEPCIFHPKEPECISPSELSECRFASNAQVLEIAAARSVNCSAGRACHYDAEVDESMQQRFAFLYSEIPSFTIGNAGPGDAGLYVVVALCDERPTTWTHVYLSTLDKILDVHEIAHKPGFDDRVLSSNDDAARGVRPGAAIEKESGRLRLSGALIASIVLVAAAVVTTVSFCGACVFRWRRRCHRKTQAPGNSCKYMSLPQNHWEEFYDDVRVGSALSMSSLTKGCPRERDQATPLGSRLI